MGVFNDFIGWLGKKMLRNAALGPFATIGFSLRDIDSVNKGNSSGSTAVDSWLNSQTQAGPTGRDIWLANREDTVNQRTVSDLRAAGLNPALMYNGGASQVPVSSASSGNPAGLSDIIQLAMLPLQMQSAKADISLKESEANRNNADVNRINAESEGLQLSNNWIDRLNKAKEDSLRMSIELDDNRKWQIRQDIAESRVRCTKAVAEVIEVEARTELEFSQMALNQATAKRIVELLPYEKLLKSAQTDAERASAEANFARAAYENGLITNGMIEFECRKANAEADFAAVRAQIANPDFEPSNSKADVVCRNIVAGLKRTFMMLSAN